MEIIRATENLTPEDKYKLTMAPGSTGFKNIVDQIIEVDKFAHYTDVNSEGELQEILSIMTPEGEVFGGNSKTLRDDFFKMIDTMKEWGGEVKQIKVIGGTTKAGRPYVTCTLA